MNRRHFLAAAASAAAVARAAALPAAEPTGPPVIDTHQHLWDLKKFQLPWIAKDSPLGRSYLLADYDAATRGLNVVKTVYMEVDVDPAQQDAEADYVLGLMAQPGSKMAGAVISGRPASEGFKKYLSRYKDNRLIKGVRQVLHGAGTPAGYCLGDDFVRGIRLLGEWGKSFDLCMRAPELPDAAKLIDKCPDTRFILDHCGNPNVQARDNSAWKRDLAEVAKRKNAVVKVSGIMASAKPGAWTVEQIAPIVTHTIDTFGPDRVLFAGDWPVCTLAATFRQWLEAVRAVVKDRPAAEQRKLLHDNAMTFYGL